MLKTYQYFFVALFLGSMVFTVFQYIPILEEEIHAGKTMSKKADNESSESDAADDDAGDDEPDTDKFFDDAASGKFQLLLSNSKFDFYHENCPSLIDNIHTPPPKS